MEVKDWLGENNEIGINIYENKYRQNGETFDEFLDRVSGGNEAIRKLILEKKFLFGGRILSNRGMDKYGIKMTMSNCYVIAPPDDNIESIYEAATKLARTYSYGGGCGVDISKLSPRGTKVNNTAKTSSGAVSFMELFNTTTGLIGQNGRRGALMISIDCTHPDLVEFIDVKSDLNKINQANISIKITDAFMRAVKNEEDWELTFTREETGEKIVKWVNAKDIFERLCRMNWDYAEPGILFWDRINNWNLLSEDDEFEYAGTNPCAEEPLPAGGSCLLGSINLSEFVKETEEGPEFDYDDFKYVVREAVFALNEVLDEGLPLHPLAEQRDSVRDWRQIGLGIFGLADMLIKLGIRYGSADSMFICDIIGTHMINEAIKASSDIAVTKGSYPKYKKDCVLASEFFKKNTYESTKELVERQGLHNSQLLTIAPTGSLSTMLGVSGGIEPIFANYYTRKTESLHGEDVYYKVYTPIVEEYMKKHNITDDKDLPEYFVTAQDIQPFDRIEMQSTWQNYIDASISSTINLPKETTVEDVINIYEYASDCGLKGVTIFRDGCARTGILTFDNGEEKVEMEPVGLARGEVIKIDDNCVGLKRSLQTGCGTLHCQAFFHPENGDLVEIYLSKGSSGGCNNFMTGLSRLVSLSARGGISVEDIVDQLKSSGTCPSYAVRAATKKDVSKGSSCPVAVGYALLDMYKEVMGYYGEEVEEVVPSGPPCRICGEPTVAVGGCYQCVACGDYACD